jgi:hypothetical protein
MSDVREWVLTEGPRWVVRRRQSWYELLRSQEATAQVGGRGVSRSRRMCA